MAWNLKSGFEIIFYIYYPWWTSFAAANSLLHALAAADVHRVKLKAKLDIIITFKLIIES